MNGSLIKYWPYSEWGKCHSLEDLNIIESEFSWKSFDFDLPFKSLDNFISFIWGNIIVDEWDNNDTDEIIENFRQLNSQNYLTEKYNS